MGLTGQYILAMTPQEVQEQLDLNQLKDKIWYVVPSCATTGDGLFEGLVGFPSVYTFDLANHLLTMLFRVGFPIMSRHRP